jgi:hypothetical protein
LVVERNSLWHLARQRHACAGRQIVAQVIAELIDKNEEFAVGRRELKAGGIQIDDGRARGLDGFDHLVECRDNLGRC